MHYREATAADIPEIQEVRNSVRENVLSDPALVTDEDCLAYITRRGKGWVCEEAGMVLGFAIADLEDHNIWALFLLPEAGGKGIGKTLHTIMLDWYFTQTAHSVWLSTAPGTRAEGFYRKMGWTEIGTYGKGEIKFEMSREAWQQRTAKPGAALPS